jgi:hypothetical protein
MILQVFQRITARRILIQLSLDCPNNPTRWHLQIFFSAFSSSFHTPFSCQASLLSFRPHQEIPRIHQTSPNYNVLYAVDKDIFKIINDK